MPKKVNKAEDAEKREKLTPEDWESAEVEPEAENAEPGVEAKPKETADPQDAVDEDVEIVPEPPRDSSPRGPRDAVWRCASKHETRGFENLKPECRISNCPTPNDLRLTKIYEEKQRRAKDKSIGG